MASYFSCLVSDAMDCIGYSEQSMKRRAHLLRETYDILSQHYTDLFQIELILAGSKSEGVVPFNGSDLDIMGVLQFCISVDDGRLEERLNILETNKKGCPPGYTKLRLLNNECTDIPFILNVCSLYDTIPFILNVCSLYDISSGTLFLTSAAFSELHAENKNYFQYDGIKRYNETSSGPALSVIMQPCLMMGINQNNVYADLVIAIRYYSANILQEWSERKRHFEWPPHCVIEDVSTMEGYVVPVGHKLSEEQNFEWRICYTTAERKLIASFNETQLKLYVMLKMVLKDILKPTIDCVSSYMIKNIVFWVIEHNAMSAFTPSNLIRFVTHALWILLHCFRNNHLPNYIIPKRNLLSGKIQSKQKTLLKNLLRELLNKRDTFVFRCEKLKNAVYVTEANRCLATRIQSWRDEIEQLAILFNLNLMKRSSRNMVLRRTFFYDLLFEGWKDNSYLIIVFRLFYLLSLGYADILDGVSGFRKMENILHNLLS